MSEEEMLYELYGTVTKLMHEGRISVDEWSSIMKMLHIINYDSQRRSK